MHENSDVNSIILFKEIQDEFSEGVSQNLMA